MPIQLYNTLTRRKDLLVPGDPGRVTMYVCGPTVYSRAHIGNARPAVVFDVLRRLLRHEYGADHVVYARNITDIDDRIIAESAATGVPIDAITRRTEDWYLADMGALGVEPPDIAPHATTSIPAMVAMTERLIAKGHAYAADGHVLFDVPSFSGYGALSRRPLDEMIAGARVEVAPYKKSPADFVLWKPSTADQPGWDSPKEWGCGRGRPGWHIECSAMIAESLGTTIDIHGGGQDLQFPHHENELAQSTCAHDGAPLARIWMHNGFLNMGGSDKMSKSLGNVMGVDELLVKGWHGEVLRLALLSAHYRQPLEWNEALLEQCKSTLDTWYEAKRTLKHVGTGKPLELIISPLYDDLNTPSYIASVTKFARDSLRLRQQADEEDKAGKQHQAMLTRRQAWHTARHMVRSAQFFGFLTETSNAWRTGARLKIKSESLKNSIALSKTLSDKAIETQIAARTSARAAKNWAESDRLRDELAAQGIVLEDGPAGTSWRRG